jgi:hypothetical protein
MVVGTVTVPLFSSCPLSARFTVFVVGWSSNRHQVPEFRRLLEIRGPLRKRFHGPKKLAHLRPRLPLCLDRFASSAFRRLGRLDRSSAAVGSCTGSGGRVDAVYRSALVSDSSWARRIDTELVHVNRSLMVAAQRPVIRRFSSSSPAFCSC